MPKTTEQEKHNRSKAIQQGYKKAAQVPLQTARLCEETLDLSEVVAEKGNTNSITDAGVAALAAEAGVHAALFNVKINLGSIKDESFKKEIMETIEELEKNARTKTQSVLSIIDHHLS